MAAGDEEEACAIATDRKSVCWRGAAGAIITAPPPLQSFGQPFAAGPAPGGPLIPAPPQVRMRTLNWLLRTDGALVSPRGAPADAPVARHTHVEDAADVVQMIDGLSTTGAWTACLLWRDGKLACRGDASMQCAPNPKFGCWETGPVPLMVTVCAGVRVVAGRPDPVCIGTANGSVLCRGDNRSGILGVEGKERIAEFTPVRGVDHVRSLAVGGYVSCAARDDGHVLCWGSARRGVRGGRPALGGGAKAGDATPELILGVDDAQDVAAGGVHACVLRRNGRVVCFGNNEHGQLGIGESGTSPMPHRVTILDR
jgi:hypothetical protein